MLNAKDAEEKRERPLLAFQVITDTHVTADPDHAYNRNLDRALADIAAHAEESRGIMHVGDVTDHGLAEEYDAFARIWRRYADRLPDIRFATGNHDVGLGVWDERLHRFLAATGMPGPYHDYRIEGYPFLFLGTEEGLELFCSLSERQLAWLDAKLGEVSRDRPAFVFLHQPLKDTVAGSLEAQRWYGVEQDETLKAVLAKHPHAIVFTGHTHWEMDAPHTFYDGGGTLPPMFNAASVAYLWTDEDERKEGSQGYYVEVYRDRVLVRGRDFTRGTWVENARFEIKSSLQRQLTAE
ncbi:metallophosphoesterase family protein [Cohnella nanjingensis]|uniref:Metallophosphoesterase n=1 Tax=Cohnella nanjingensis TaxID=1387779 RepID=A0A7X0RW11_9BACL|nr:metallophosphoesterase [Cohnella nanjingensis]MBB6674645.1 metallophosphoesterase [Cohnella nanjingensis]